MLFGFQAVPLHDGLPRLGNHVLPVLRLGRAGAVFACDSRKFEMKNIADTVYRPISWITQSNGAGTGQVATQHFARCT